MKIRIQIFNFGKNSNVFGDFLDDRVIKIVKTKTNKLRIFILEEKQSLLFEISEWIDANALRTVCELL